jgi:hypothetical protein
MLENKLSHDIRYSADVKVLQQEIKKEVGVDLSLNTLRRALGVLDDGHEPSRYTLDMLAKYLGYDYWENLLEAINDEKRSVFTDINEVKVDSLHAGDTVELSYSPDRRLKLRYEGSYNFTVTESENGKLKEDDVIEVYSFVKDYPFIVKQVTRNGVNLGNYIGGKASGITSINVTKKHNNKR